MILNEETLNNLKTLMGEQFPTLVDTFIHDTDVIITKLETAVQENNAEDIKRYAHTLCGSAGNFGLETLYTLCHNIELLALDDNIAAVEQQLSELKVAFTQAKDLLNTKI